MNNKLLITLLIEITSLLFEGCHEPDAPPSAPFPSQPSLSDSHIPTGKLNKTAVFDILAPDTPEFSSRRFNRWDNMPKTKDQVHIFAHPANSLELDRFALSGTKHLVAVDQLVHEMAQALAQTNASRLIIFIETHGDSSGRLCYENINRCTLTEKVLIDALQTHAQLPEHDCNKC